MPQENYSVGYDQERSPDSIRMLQCEPHRSNSVESPTPHFPDEATRGKRLATS